MIRWDTNRGKILSQWSTDLRQTKDSGKYGSASEADETSLTGTCEIFNPPFVHDIAVSSTSRTCAVACGDGTVLMTKLSGKKSGPPSPEDVVALGRENGGHASSVSTLSYICDESILLSGGNDKHIVIWSIPQQELEQAPASTSLIVGHRVYHGQKINRICPVSMSSTNAKFAVVDTSNCLSLYDIH